MLQQSISNIYSFLQTSINECVLQYDDLLLIQPKYIFCNRALYHCVNEAEFPS